MTMIKNMIEPWQRRALQLVLFSVDYPVIEIMQLNDYMCCILSHQNLKRPQAEINMVVSYAENKTGLCHFYLTASLTHRGINNIKKLLKGTVRLILKGTVRLILKGTED